MQSFGQFFAQLWLSSLPRQLAYAICTAAVFEILVWLVHRKLRVALRPALAASRHPDPVVRAVRGRLLLRPPMVLSRAVLYVIAIALILRIFGLELRSEIMPLLGAAFAAALVATWPLLQDACRGYALIFQDVWTVGDRVRVGDVTGVVEAMGLLHTRLRADDGTLVTLANGRAREIVNLTRAAEGSEQAGEA